MTLKVGRQKDIKVVVTYDSPLKAPVAKGQIVGEAKIIVPDQEPRTVPLFAEKDVPRVKIFEQLKEIIKYMLFSGKSF